MVFNIYVVTEPYLYLLTKQNARHQSIFKIMYKVCIAYHGYKCTSVETIGQREYKWIEVWIVSGYKRKQVDTSVEVGGYN